MQLKDIPVSSITHLHYAFAYIAPGSFEITTMDGTVPIELFSQFAGLKKQNPALKVIVSIGGWTFNDNGTITQPVFGDIAGSSGNRAKFIDNLLDFMQNYGFDGVDFDWVSNAIFKYSMSFELQTKLTTGIPGCGRSRWPR
jgi:chitinase